MLRNKILFEDNHILVLEKLPGQPVQSDISGDESLYDLVKEYIKEKYQKPGNVYLGLVHRLDRPVGGVMVFARTSKAMARLSEAFRSRQTEKEYLAVVCEKPPKEKDTLVHYLKKNTKTNTSKVHEKMISGAKEARLEYEYWASSDNYHLLKINLHTGRHHQIRAQLSYVGMPIKGDIKYGAPRTNPGPYIHLHAWKLAFHHPVLKKKMIFHSYPESDDPLWNFFKNKIKNS
ncbi:MAG: RNA pseudouridine synthase [Bacteroidia bacterium]|nr:RNA pseudouridine synthase [Bacteroidia bacterium]